jgi:CHAD domain-containing protein
MSRHRPLRQGVLTAFARVLMISRRAARAAARDPIAAVHEYRKSLRRARAVVTLLRPCIGKPAAQGVVRHLQDAFRATSALRDADVLPATLSSLPPVPEDEPARRAIELGLQLDQIRARRETAETLARCLPSLRALPAALDVLLSPEFSAHEIERGLARSRRRERRALERARQTGSDEDLHEWRKRVKEVRYQVELLASSGTAELKKRETSLGNLARELGSVTDLTLLSRHIERRQREGAVPPATALLDRIRQSAHGRSREILERGEQLFENNPKLFARQVIAERG